MEIIWTPVPTQWTTKVGDYTITIMIRDGIYYYDITDDDGECIVASTGESFEDSKLRALKAVRKLVKNEYERAVDMESRIGKLVDLMDVLDKHIPI